MSCSCLSCCLHVKSRGTSCWMKCSSSMELDIHSTSGSRPGIRSFMFNTCSSADISLELLLHKEHNVHMLSQHRQTHRQINLCESIQQTKNPLIIRPTNQQNIHLSTYISVYPNKKPRFICLTNQPYKTTIPSCVLLTIQLSIHKNICPTN